MTTWATSKLTQLSETLAPPPSTPSHRFLSALSQNDETCRPRHPTRCSRAPRRVRLPQQSGHVGHTRGGIARRLEHGEGSALEGSEGGFDGLQRVVGAPSRRRGHRELIAVGPASILLKTNEGATAYDVASSQAVRGYLLPRQLQLETKECLDNGGKGLMPGIDLGGCRVNYNNLAPPPVIGGMGPPPMAGGGPPMQNSSYDPSAALMQPPPMRGIGIAPSPRQPPHGVANASPMQGTLNAGGAYPAEAFTNVPGTSTQPMEQWQPPPVSIDAVTSSSPHVAHEQQQQQQQHREQQQQNQWQPPVAPNEAVVAPSHPQGTQHQIQEQQQPQPRTAQPEPPQPQQPQPPRSNNSQSTPSSYALRGGNANVASILNESTSGRKIYKPDGFHSSSNDKELQAKYGHVENEFEKNRKAAVPPPPVSGGAPISSSAGPVNAPPMSGGYNPYSAGRPASGYIGGSGRARYPTYCPVSDSVSAPPSLSGGGFGYGSAPVPVYANFHQGGFNSGVQQPQRQQGAGQMQQNQPNIYGVGYNQQSHGTAVDSSVPPPGHHQPWTGQIQQNQPNFYGVGYNQQTHVSSPDSNVPFSVQQLHWTGDTQGNQAAGVFSPSSNNAQSDGYSQQSIGAPALQGQEQQHQTVEMQQNQSRDYTYSSPPPAINVVNDNGISVVDENIVKPVYDGQQSSPSINTSTASLSPPKQSQPFMAADAAANMFGTPHADTPGKSVVLEGRDSLPSLPIDSSNAQELFSSPPLDSSSDSPVKSNAAADHFGSSAPSSQAITADNHVKNVSEAAPNHSDSFFGSPPHGENNPNRTSVASDASSFFCSGEKDAGEQTAEKPHASSGVGSGATSTTASAPSAARLKSFGGLPPPPVIGGLKPLSTPRSFVSSPVDSSLPPPPVARSSPSNAKEEDIVADELADVSLS
ncbi:hypothetical protein HJC23_005639 [Cyclotella cryptica]|uniref:Uncharacterized protein n=1 Tax=Cyclotella cryptica TaxID=29204 RepID=A0ABD3PYQ6_9STRA